MARPMSQPSFLPNLAVSLDSAPSTPGGALSEPYTLNGRTMSPMSHRAMSPMSPSKRAAASAASFDPVYPLLTEDSLARAEEEVLQAQQKYEALLEAKAAMHEDSKTWWELNDPHFSDQLRVGHHRMKKLDFEESSAQADLNHKRLLSTRMRDAHAAQDVCAKRQRFYEMRRQETQQAALREQEALGALARAKADEGTAKKLLKQVGQVSLPDQM